MMLQIDEYPSFSTLQALAKGSTDIDVQALKDPEKLKKSTLYIPGLKFFYPLQRVNQEVIKALLSLAEEAKLLARFKGMLEGYAVNFVEGYYSKPATHHLFRSPSYERALQDKQKLHELLLDLDERFTDAVIVGIGGSELGIKAVYHALNGYRKKNLHFLSNLDPDHHQLLDSLPLSTTVFIIISKSGSTLETKHNEQLVRETLGNKGCQASQHMIAITQAGSALDHEGFLARFYLCEGVGGRFSLSSVVGALPLSFAFGKKSYEDFLKGAYDVDRHVASSSPKENGPLVAALLCIWNRIFLHAPTACIIPYSSLLEYLPFHLQQLVMESNGKRVTQKGELLRHHSSSIIWGGVGTNAQHSFFQLLHQGTHLVPVDFIAFLKPQKKSESSQNKLLANLFAQGLALAMGKQSPHSPHCHFPGNRPSSLLLGKKLDPYTMGCLISFYESKTLLEGFLMGINSFDQEGVELGKSLAEEFIEFFHQPSSAFPWKTYIEHLYDF